MSRVQTAMVLCVALTLSLLAMGQQARQASPPKTGSKITPTRNSVAPGVTPVKVVLLRSWGVTSGWEDLKTQWQNYGTVPITIDDSTYINSDFTYQDLVNSGANVIVLSDPAGGVSQYTKAEVAAVAQYAMAGHTVLGTYLVFEFGSQDDRGLMPVFGLNPTFPYTFASISNSFTQTRSSCLFRNIPTTWQSSGYPYSQVPTQGKWTASTLKSATLLADSDSGVGVISVYKPGNYTAVYISNFPEYNGGTYDLQLLYNASTCFQ